MKFKLPRPQKSWLASGIAHGCALFLLSSNPLNFAPEEAIEPEVIEATILPPPEVVPAAQPIAPQPKVGAQPKPLPTKAQETHIASTAPAKDGKAEPNIAPSSGDGKPPANDGQPPITPPATTTTNAVPIDAPIKDGGFVIKYDVFANYKGNEGGGGATFTFNRKGDQYSATLVSQASIAKFSAKSAGEVRDNTVATTDFKDGFSIKFLGMGNERAGTNFRAQYQTQQFHFGSNEVQPLPQSAVYDYLSAMVYIQAVLQKQRGQVSALTLPIVKKSKIENANVQFAAQERLSTYEGAFQAIPATIIIPSSSIQGFKMWFVPEKNYRPLQIEITFKTGKALLISRESN